MANNNPFQAYIEEKKRGFNPNQAAEVQALGEHIRDMQGQGLTLEKRKEIFDQLVTDWLPDVDDELLEESSPDKNHVYQNQNAFANIYGRLNNNREKQEFMARHLEVEVTDDVAGKFFQAFEKFARDVYGAGPLPANGNENQNGGRRKRSKKTRKHKKHTKKTRKHKKHSKKTRKH